MVVQAPPKKVGFFFWWGEGGIQEESPEGRRGLGPHGGDPEVNSSQTLLGQSGGDVLGQGRELRRIRHVEAPGGGQMAVPLALRGQRARQARGLDDDLSPVVHPGPGLVTEHQPVALDLTGAE